MVIETIVAMTVTVLIPVAFGIMSWFNLQLERKRAVKREQELLAAVMSNNVAEYIESVGDLNTSAKMKLALTKADNELALNVNNLESKIDRGIPVG